MASDRSWMKKPNDAHTFVARGKVTEGYAAPKDVYESDAKMLAGKEKREMEALFGKKAPVSTTATTKKFEPSKASPAKVPSMFAAGGGASGTLMSSGSAATMKVDRHVFDPTTGGAKTGRPMDASGVSKLNMGSAGVMQVPKGVFDPTTGGAKAGRPMDSGGVSKLNMGSAGVMDTSRNRSVDVANRGSFGAQGASKPAAGSTKTVSRDPNSQYGVLRKFAWEQ